MAINNGTQTLQLANKAPLAVSTLPSYAFGQNGTLQGYSSFTFSVTTTGSPTSYSISIQGSVDNVQWTAIPFAGPLTADAQYAVSGSTSWHYLRVNITAVSGGTNPTVTVYAIGVM